MARYTVGDDAESFFVSKSPSGSSLKVEASKRYTLWDARSGGTRYTDVLHADGSSDGAGSVNGVAHADGVLTASTLGGYGAQLPDELVVDGAWVEVDGWSTRLWVEARSPSGASPVSAAVAQLDTRVVTVEAALPTLTQADAALAQSVAAAGAEASTARAEVATERGRIDAQAVQLSATASVEDLDGNPVPSKRVRIILTADLTDIEDIIVEDVA